MTKFSNSGLSPSELLARAFDLDAKASLTSTTGTQTMAAGIFAFYAEIEQSSGLLGATKPKFAVYKERGAAFDTFKAAIIKANVTQRISSKDMKANPKLTSQIQASTNAKNAAQMIALNKGFDLADALHHCGVSNDSYDIKSGVFSVPPHALIEPDATPLGLLKTAEKNGARIPLDGKTYRCDVNERSQDFKAYPARVLQIAGFSKNKKSKPLTEAEMTGASATTSTGSASADEIRAATNTWSLEKILSEASKLLTMASDVTKLGEPVAWSSLTDQERNALEGINIFVDECKALRSMVDFAASCKALNVPATQAKAG